MWLEYTTTEDAAKGIEREINIDTGEERIKQSMIIGKHVYVYEVQDK